MAILPIATIVECIQDNGKGWKIRFSDGTESSTFYTFDEMNRVIHSSFEVKRLIEPEVEYLRALAQQLKIFPLSAPVSVVVAFRKTPPA